MWNDRRMGVLELFVYPSLTLEGRILFAPFEVLSGDDARCSWRRAHARHRPGNAK